MSQAQHKLACLQSPALQIVLYLLTLHISSYLLVADVQVLFPDVVAGLLLLVHTHMSSARHSRHAVRALAPLQALLQLLGPNVCEPATFRYAVHIVLQAMDNM